MPEVRNDVDGGEWADVLSLLEVLPHRYPFVLVDKLRVLEGGRRALGIKRITGSEWLGNHASVPGGAMPGLLVVEALAQTSAGVLVGLLDGATGAIGYFAAAHRVRFRALPRPGDTLLLSVELVQYRRGVARLEGIASIDGVLSTSAKFTAVVRGRAA